MAEEEVLAMEAILGSECARLPSGCLEVTLLWDPKTGEAPWAFSVAAAATADGGASAGAAEHCKSCVLPGCRQPTNRHKPS
eukprot:2871384-Prymnesium_polylepis.1